MKANRAALPVAVLLMIAGCASRLERPVNPFESKIIEVAPSAPYETCVPLLSGDRFFFTYKADPPMAFSIVRRTADTTVAYLVRELSRDESGVFFVPLTQDYCLVWSPPPEEVPWPTLLRYTVQLNLGNPVR
ncbi:MAG: hypothetical protein ABI854_01410 [Betaproteobacteria bacterium]